MNLIQLIPSLVVVVLVVGVAAIDIRRLTIPNAITLPTLILGVVFHTAADGSAGAAMALIGVAAGFCVLFPLYLAGGMGAGDVKLFAGIGAWLGLIPTLQALAIACVCAAVASFVVRARRTPSSFEPSRRILTSDSSRRAGQPLPFGPMAAVGTLVAIAAVYSP